MGDERITNLGFKPQPKPEPIDLKSITPPKIENKTLPSTDKQLFLKQENLGGDALKLRLFNKISPQKILLESGDDKSPGSISRFTDPYPPGAELTFAESKGASDIAYNGQEGEVYQFPDGTYYRVEDVTVEDSGLRGVTLRQVVPDEEGGYMDNPADDRVIVAFAGTNGIDDVNDDILQGVGLTPEQFDQALEYTRSVQAEAEANGESVSLTGHSLGGALATYCSIETGLPATAINSAPLSDNKIPDGVNFDDQITQYYTEGEILTDLDNVNPFDERPGRGVEVEGAIDESELDFNWFEELIGVARQVHLAVSITNHTLGNTAPEVDLPDRVYP